MEMSTQRSKKRTHSEAPGKECANPIFEKWIIEWRDDAVAKNSKVQYVYSKVPSKIYYSVLKFMIEKLFNMSYLKF